MKISVIMSNRNDVAMLAVTVRSALEELSVIDGGGEVVIVDNSDEKYRDAAKSVISPKYLDNEVRFYRQDEACLFTAREEAARQAAGEYIFCVDSHMIFGRDSIANAVEFMDYYTDLDIGFGSIPLNWLCQHESQAKHDMKNLHGGWNGHYTEPRPISWKGMPWICRRDWFLNELGGYGALSENGLSWGGGDMYLGVKTWLLGFENWAIPSRPVMHIGPLPEVARKFHKYRVYKKSGERFACLGFLVAFYALGVDDDYFDRPEIETFLSRRIGDDFKNHLGLARRLAVKDRELISFYSKTTFDELEARQPWNK